MRILICLISLTILANSCTRKQTPSIEMIDNTCFKGRDRVGDLNNEFGEVLVVNDIFLLKVSDSQQYMVCDLPYEYADPGTRVIFSGSALTIKANERLMGTPLHLETIRKR